MSTGVTRSQHRPQVVWPPRTSRGPLQSKITAGRPVSTIPRPPEHNSKTTQGLHSRTTPKPPEPVQYHSKTRLPRPRQKNSETLRAFSRPLPEDSEKSTLGLAGHFVRLGERFWQSELTQTSSGLTQITGFPDMLPGIAGRYHPQLRTRQTVVHRTGNSSSLGCSNPLLQTRSFVHALAPTMQQAQPSFL